MNYMKLMIIISLIVIAIIWLKTLAYTSRIKMYKMRKCGEDRIGWQPPENWMDWQRESIEEMPDPVIPSWITKKDLDDCEPFANRIYRYSDVVERFIEEIEKNESRFYYIEKWF